MSEMDYFMNAYGLSIDGTISWRTQAIRMSTSVSPSLPDEEVCQYNAALAHELIHYFQFISTLDGIDWFFQTLKWTDAIKSHLKKNKGSICLPLYKPENPKYSSVVNAYNYYSFLMSTYWNSDFSNLDNAPNEPLLDLGKFGKVLLTNRHIYEAYARLNEMLFLSKQDTKHSLNVMDKMPIITEYDWPMMLQEKYSEIDLFLVTIASLLDFALMRPSIVFKENSRKFSIEERIPSLRFINALRIVCSEDLWIKWDTPKQILGLHGVLASKLGWQKIEHSVHDAIEYAEGIADSFFIGKEYPSSVAEYTEEQRNELVNLREYRIIHILKALDMRENYPLMPVLAALPGLHFEEIAARFTPPSIECVDGFLADPSLTEFQWGFAQYHAFKTEICEEMLFGNYITCPVRKRFPDEKCQLCSECPGVFPNLRIPNPTCGINNVFKTMFGHYLKDVVNNT